MAYDWMPDSIPTDRELAALERSYRRDLQDVAAARACCESLRHVTDRDEQEILRALARIEFLRRARHRLAAEFDHAPAEIGIVDDGADVAVEEGDDVARRA